MPEQLASSTFTFTVSLTTGSNTSTREFTITNTADNDAPVWATSAGALADATGGGYSQSLSATDPEGSSVTYAINSGSLPAGLSMNSSGSITGTASSLDGNTYSFTVRASDSLGVYADRSFSIVSANPVNEATGGTITDSGGYRTHVFTSSGTFSVSEANSNIQLLVIAGGGQGGVQDCGQANTAGTGGGGGAGGLIYVASQAISATNYTITIGGSETNSSALSSTAIAGGHGGNARSTAGQSGGSGGGRACCTGAGSGTSGQGNAGQSDTYPAGGGGYSTVGGAGDGGSHGGGNGKDIKTWFPSVSLPNNGLVAGGGDSSTPWELPSTNNNYGGGHSFRSNWTGGIANTGGGGSARQWGGDGSNCSGAGGLGGSGLVVIRYPY